MNLAEFDVATLNLDPGVVRLPYTPDIDVRTYVNYDAIVDKYQLGPNGGLIVAMDHGISDGPLPGIEPSRRNHPRNAPESTPLAPVA